MKRKHHGKSLSTGLKILPDINIYFAWIDSLYNNNLVSSPVKEGFSMDPMLEHALDFDTDENEERE